MTTQKVSVAKTTQAAIPELGKEEKTLYYLIIGEGEKKVVINVGQKTHDQVQALTEEPKAKLTIKN